LSVLSHVFGAVDKTSFLVFHRTVKYAISSSSSLHSPSFVLHLVNHVLFALLSFLAKDRWLD